jgi:putative ABC transport system ATP-binding protein
VGIPEKATARPSTLSGGQKQRLAIARALFHRPALLIGDEPTGNLDSGTAEEVLALFTALCRDEKVTLVLVTHDCDDGRRGGPRDRDARRRGRASRGRDRGDPP